MHHHREEILTLWTTKGPLYLFVCLWHYFAVEAKHLKRFLTMQWRLNQRSPAGWAGGFLLLVSVRHEKRSFGLPGKPWRRFICDLKKTSLCLSAVSLTSAGRATDPHSIRAKKTWHVSDIQSEIKVRIIKEERRAKDQRRNGIGLDEAGGKVTKEKDGTMSTNLRH